MTETIDVRPLRPEDIPALTGVLARAYASQQRFELRLRGYLRQVSVATFIADRGGAPVGMVVGNDYGPIGYVSQMGVDPVVQRQGIGTALMDALTAWADARGFAALELDATPAGEPLYVRYGFRTATHTLVYEAAGQGGAVRGVRAYVPGDLAALCAADGRAFGADRSEVLRLLVEPPNAVFVSDASGPVDGYAVAQPRTEWLGPVIAADAQAALRLIDAARSVLPAGHRLGIPAESAGAATLAAKRGYRFTRTLAHMVRGTRPPAARNELFARINLGQG